jgi:putative protease
VSKGDRVFRVRNAELDDAAKSTYGASLFQGNNGLVALDARVVAVVGEKLEIAFSLRSEGDTGESEGEPRGAEGDALVEPESDRETTWQATVQGAVVERARTKPLTAEDIREHVGRVGGTAFTIRSWDIQLGDEVGMSFSALHQLRAEAIKALEEALLKPWRNRHHAAGKAVPALSPARKGGCRVGAIVSDEAHARAAAQGGAEVVYLHSLRFECDDEAGELQASGAQAGKRQAGGGRAGKLPGGLRIVWMLPAITHGDELEAAFAILRQGSSHDRQRIVANNLGEIEMLRAAGALDCEMEGGPALGICNREAIEALARLGMTQAWLSPELCHKDIAALSPDASLPLALTIVGRQEVMVTEHCLLMAQGPCAHHCATCVRRKTPRLLEDRKGYRFPIRTDDAGRSHLFNAVSLDLVPSMPELVGLGISTLVVDGTLMTTKELKTEVARAVRGRDLAVKGAGSLPKREGYTTGHFFRGVW